ncbi:hypothetical protein L226DRAFT_560379 [Lentinus tigrinus ALCF2SS1-7]|uniref:Zinc-finger domain-containing protein n=1 Tax=Lentinus tigrinus ALCF2SS1-6 TaxID=1328759 RepID=A0A5C2RTS0_9APHY|nr:hypothetical protein L227DRAFT_555843 [Lentinus tigrinus ALCF2SS1-6]RPD75333.1 hypothetical protein L226DRAFT_560379 [Lentinus tigrinus ALCF2SS1-7]
MDRPTSAARRRRSQVFVEIPTSPLTTKSGKADRTGPPEGTPLKAVVMNVDNAPSSSASTSSQLKRKSPEESQPHTMEKQKDDAQAPRPKKPKTENASRSDAKAPAKKPSNSAKDATNTGDASKAVEGLLRCHQCSRQMLPADMALCSFKRPNGQRCSFRYCKSCVRNRYQQDFLAIHARSPQNATAEERAQHVNDVDYHYRCPRCNDNCNCRVCRKAKGLPATGNLNLAARRASMQDPVVASNDESEVGGSTSKAKLILSGSKKKPTDDGEKTTKPRTAARTKGKATEPSTSGPSKGKPHVLIPPSPHHTKRANAVPTKKTRAVKEKAVAPPKPMPKPVWTALSTPLTYNDALTRMNIREFLLRFAHLADVSRTHLEELEELATNDPYTTTTNEDDEDESPLVGWVSEPALKAILIGLVSIFSRDADENDEDTSAFVKTIHALRASGANVSKIWAALSSLRDATDCNFPDPLPPPPSARQRSTRSGSRDSLSATVVCTAQFVPIVAALVENALETKVIQDDFERGATQEKDLARAARELSAAENARWKEAKAKRGESNERANGKADQAKGKSKAPAVSLAERRAALAAHEAALAKYEFAHHIAAAECISRFGPLGRDTEGRIYYAITPGVTEREAAVELLEGGKGNVKFGKRRVAEEDVRKEMKHWSWFVAIWGRKPEGAEVAKPKDDEDAEDDGNEDDERWWAFWQPEQVSKLAEWLAMKYSIDLEAKRPTKDSSDSAVLKVDDADAEKLTAKDNKSRGRPSNASSANSVSRPRKFASLNKDSDSEDESRSDEYDDETDADGDVHMRFDRRGEPVPTKNDLRALARGLKDYAELLEWRIKHSAKESGDTKSKKPPAAGKDKGKGVEKGGISPATFYGQ